MQLRSPTCIYLLEIKCSRALSHCLTLRDGIIDVLEGGQPTCPEDVSRTTGKPLWRVSRKTWRISSTRISSRSVTTGADMAAATGTRSSAFLAVGSRGSHGTHFTYGNKAAVRCMQGSTLWGGKTTHTSNFLGIPDTTLELLSWKGCGASTVLSHPPQGEPSHKQAFPAPSQLGQGGSAWTP